jgi:hypothetical protein
LAKAKDDWGKGTLTIGKGENKIVLPMYPTPYHGETQDEATKVTNSNTYGSESESTKLITKEQPTFKSIGLGEYIAPLIEEDSDIALLNWKKSPVYGINVSPDSELEPPYQTDSEEFIDQLSHVSLPNLKITNSACIDMNLGTDNDPKNIKIYSGLDSKLLKEWLQFFKDTKDVFAWTYKDLKGVPPEICQHQIVLESNAKPVRQRQYRMNPKYSLMVKEEIDKLLECGFIYLVPYSEWVSPIIVVPKKNEKLRICVNFRKLNFVTQKDYFPLPFTDAILDGVAGHECYSFLDGFSGYNQVQIALVCRAFTTFTIDWGTYAYNVMPFGLCNAPATFQRVMTTAFQKYLRKFIEIFLDDFCVFSTHQQHAECLRKCFEQCRAYGISINVAKFQFLVPCGRLLGHIVSKEGIAVDPDKVAALLLLPMPEHITGVKAFLGATSYYRCHIYFYAQIVAPLTYLTKQTDVPGVWTDECTVAFEKLKRRLSKAPVLIAPNWDKPFEVYVDASNFAIGSVLSQKDTKGHDRPICFASLQLSAAEKNYSITEREGLGMVYSVQKYRHYLLGYKFTFHVDHDALKYMINKPQLSGRIACWVLLLQEFNFVVNVRPGKRHANADFLSRISEKVNPESINDSFPDAHLFNIEIIPAEYANVIHYLSTSTFSLEYNDKQKQRLAHKALPYTLIAKIYTKREKMVF